MYRKLLRVRWIAHRTNSSILHGLHLPMNRLNNFERRQKLTYFGHVSRYNGLTREDNNAMNGSWEKRQRKAKTKMGENTSQMYLVR